MQHWFLDLAQGDRIVLKDQFGGRIGHFGMIFPFGLVAGLAALRSGAIKIPVQILF
jgi:hypothetical protein